MSAKSTQSMLNAVAFSRTSELAINQFGTIDHALISAEGDFFSLVPMRETNRGEATGEEEPTVSYDNGRTYKFGFSPKFCTYDKLAFMHGFCLGTVVTVAAGTGYKHTITPIDGYVDTDRSNPTTTGAQKLGGGTQYLRLASMAVQSCTETYTPGAWVTFASQMVATGKYEEVVSLETIPDLDNVLALILPTAVPGATDAERLANIDAIRVIYNGIEKQEIQPVAVSDDPLAVITIASLGGVGDTVNYEVVYQHPDPAWLPLPAAVEEPNIRVSQLVITIGGSWNGTAFEGGRVVCSDLGSLVVNYTNDGLEPKMTPCSADVGQEYAGVLKRSGRTQTITLTKELRGALQDALFNKNEYIGIHIVAEGPVFPGDAENYRYERVFPKCAYMDLQKGTADSRNQETISFEVLKGDTYPSTISIIQNLVANYVI